MAQVKAGVLYKTFSVVWLQERTTFGEGFHICRQPLEQGFYYNEVRQQEVFRKKMQVCHPTSLEIKLKLQAWFEPKENLGEGGKLATQGKKVRDIYRVYYCLPLGLLLESVWLEIYSGNQL